MAWTTPRTWVVGETPTAAIFNAHVRDNLSFLYSPPSCRVTHNAAQSLTTAVATAVAFDTERWDTDTMHDTSSNNSRITFTTAGRYLVIAQVTFAANATGARTVVIRLGGSTELAREICPAPGSPNDQPVVPHTEYVVAAAQYVEAVATQTSGGNLNVTKAANSSPEFMAHWIGGP